MLSCLSTSLFLHTLTYIRKVTLKVNDICIFNDFGNHFKKWCNVILGHFLCQVTSVFTTGLCLHFFHLWTHVLMQQEISMFG